MWIKTRDCLVRQEDVEYITLKETEWSAKGELSGHFFDIIAVLKSNKKAILMHDVPAKNIDTTLETLKESFNKRS